MGPKNGLRAFGYNSAESEPIWMKFGTLWTKCWGLTLADFGRNPLSGDSLRGSRIVFVMRITYGFRDFSLEKFYDISTKQCRSVSPCKLSEQLNLYWYCCRKESDSSCDISFICTDVIEICFYTVVWWACFVDSNFSSSSVVTCTVEQKDRNQKIE